ncbi:MAG TPA: endolytic transglycosylase MltG, partial [Longimicrobiaceae bacterium]|nr:endolytic transglycosylase MltG [Longimicrobiaceae bacterium]
MSSTGAHGAATGLILLLLTACGGPSEGEPVRFTVPRGSGLGAVSDTLANREIVQWPFAFRLYARFRGADRSLKPGVYEVQPGASWATLLDKLTTGDVVTQRIVVPEGWTARQIAGRLSPLTGVPEDSIARLFADSAVAEQHGVPGPTLEGYLYPASYNVPLGASLEEILRAMVRTYQQTWTPEMRTRADSLGMSEREVVTLASIIEAEARAWGERDTISAVYHNRLRRGMRLQADPTVQYALGQRQARLLYAHIDDVADHPYNTYSRAGLPPGPIASPSRGAIEAALNPADVDFLFFVARPDGTHIFTRTYAEHNVARRQ